MPTIYEMKENRNNIGQQLKKEKEALYQMSNDTSVSMEDIQAKKSRITDIEQRFDIVSEQLQDAEKLQNDQNKKMQSDFSQLDDEGKKVKAKAEVYRSLLAPDTYGKPSNEALQLLHALPDGNTSGGEDLLPTNMIKEVITEPTVTNKLRELSPASNIKGLEMPRIMFTIDDDDFITDTQTAKEVQAKGDSVTFGRFKAKLKVEVSDTVIHGSDIDLVSYIENGLKSAAAAKEKRGALTTTPKAGEEHMSFYQSGAITQVDGEDIYNAVLNALSDLHEDYREQASVVMRYSDFVKVAKQLSNGTTDFFNAPPERIWGVPVKFMDGAVKPIVGQFTYFRLNYDGSTYDTDKDVDKGIYKFVLTAWYDQKRLLDSAFRIANVAGTTTTTTTTAAGV
ncbi:phage major capsid protein [Salinicoccus sp. HZC-1]|uniref:phage major capsid protein n=1 Tax=Salinicoccus sp. HZC-1 TaxID=3385497 RepID=UPI00398AAC97